MVYPHDAIQDRPHEETGQDIASPPGPDSQLVPSGGGDLGRDCRGAEQQSKTDDEKSVWLSDGESHRNRLIPPTWSTPRAGICPQILLRRLAYWRFAQSHYVKDGLPSRELTGIREALRPLRTLYGRTPASEF